jgi:hypothetical protein
MKWIEASFSFLSASNRAQATRIGSDPAPCDLQSSVQSLPRQFEEFLHLGEITNSTVTLWSLSVHSVQLSSDTEGWIHPLLQDSSVDPFEVLEVASAYRVNGSDSARIRSLCSHSKRGSLKDPKAMRKHAD